MKKLLHVLPVFLLFTTISQAQLFQNFLGKATPVERCNSVAIGPDSAFVMAGNYKSTSGATLSVPAMIRLTKTGTVQWAKQFNITGSGANASGNAIYNDVVKTTAGKAGGHVTVINKGASVYVVRTNNAGAVLWSRQITTGSPKGTCIKSVYLASGALDGFYFTFTGGKANTGSALMRLDANGNSVWQRNVIPNDGISNIAFKDLQVTADGGCIITGETKDIFASEPILVKFTSGGSISFAKTWYVGAFRFSSGLAVAITPTGYVVAGATDLNNSTQNLNLVFTTNNSGTLQWCNTYSSSSISLMRSDNVACDAAGNIIFGGNAFNTAIPAFIVKVNAAGTVLFGKRYYSAVAGGDLKLSPQGYCLAGTSDFGTANEDFYIINTNTSGSVSTGCQPTTITVTRTADDTLVSALEFDLNSVLNTNNAATVATQTISTEQSRCGTAAFAEETTTASQLVVYPGRDNNVITLRYTTNETTAKTIASVYDINGSLIATAAIATNSMEKINSAKPLKGIYTVTITTNGEVKATQKILLGN